MKPRSPVVVILGHVDHGKTTLLDYIRHSHLTDKEVGGITQKIGAYEVKTRLAGYPNDKITFIDTPGHEAFSHLRSRGASVADVAVLLIDGKDGVMPQTRESIFHIRAAKIPFIVAVNKIDLPEADPDKIKNQLLKDEVVVEDKGGDIPFVQLSAKTGQGVNDLLEAILLIASEKNLSFNPENPGLGYIIDVKKDRRGIVVSVILKDGQLQVGNQIFSGEIKGKVRAMINDQGKQEKIIFPSTPVEILGFEQLPEIGAVISTKKISQDNQKKSKLTQSVKTENRLGFFLSEDRDKKLSLVLKADTLGSLEAIRQSLSTNKAIEIILFGVGEITKSDIFLAKASRAVVIGFGMVISQEIKDLAKQEKVVVKTYQIIYELLEELEEVAKMIKEKEELEKNVKGEVKILATFLIEGERVFGVKVVKGKVNLGDKVLVYRGNRLIGESKLVSLKIRAKKVNEVKKDQEAGMIFSPSLDIQVGDLVKFIL